MLMVDIKGKHKSYFKTELKSSASSTECILKYIFFKIVHQKLAQHCSNRDKWGYAVSWYFS